MFESLQTTVPDILLLLLAARFIGGLIGFERRSHHKAVREEKQQGGDAHPRISLR